MCPANIKVNCIDTQCHGNINVYIVTPKYYKPIRNVIFYIHGAGWVFGSFHTHQKLVQELSYRTNSVVIFPEYTRSPEARFPVAIEQCYAILSKIPEILKFNCIEANINQLKNLPDTMIINEEADVLRDDAKFFSDKLREANNNITAIEIPGIIHNFVMLNSLDQTNACRAAMDISTSWINCKNYNICL